MNRIILLFALYLLSACSSFKPASSKVLSIVSISTSEKEAFFQKFPLFMVPSGFEGTADDTHRPRLMEGLKVNRDVGAADVFAKIRLQKDDLLLTINNTRINALHLMNSASNSIEPGDRMDLEVLRDGKLHLLRILIQNP